MISGGTYQYTTDFVCAYFITNDTINGQIGNLPNQWTERQSAEIGRELKQVEP